MNAMDAFEAELAANDPYAPLHDKLATNDDEMLEALVRMRRTKQLSQQTVADRMHRSKTAVSNFERLGEDPHLSTIRRYAAAVGASIITRVVDFEEQSEYVESAAFIVQVANCVAASRSPKHATADPQPLQWRPAVSA